MMRGKIWIVAGGILGAVLALGVGNPPVVWDAANGFAGWGEPVNCTATRTGEVLKLVLNGRDSSIANREVALDPMCYNRIDIVYRANGLPDATTGQVFFADRNQPRWVGTQYWRFHKLRSDGEWHTLTLHAGSSALAYGLESWIERATIDKLRLDMADQFPGTIEIKSIRWSYDAPKPPLFPELPVWPQVTAQLPTPPLRKADLDIPYYSGWMVRSPDDTPANLKSGADRFAFRRAFTAPRNLQQALIQISADDRYELWINGEKVLANQQPDGWKEPGHADVTGLLKPGKQNIITGFYRNLGGVGGLLLELTMLDRDGTVHTIASDEHFQTALLPPDKTFSEVAQDETGWNPMIRQSPPPAAPWNLILPYVDIAPRPTLMALLSAPESASAGDRIDLRLSGAGSAPALDDLTILTLTASDGTVAGETSVAVTSGMVAQDGDRWHLPLQLTLPRWFGATEFTIGVRFRNCRIAGDGATAKIAVAPRKPGRRVLYTVAPDAHGTPGLLADGQSIYPLIGNCLRAFAESKFTQVPMTFRTLWCRDNGFWTGEGDYRYGVLDRLFEELLADDPETPVLLFIGLDAPHWWGAKYPDELMRFQDGTSWNYGLAPASFASMKFRHDVSAMLKALLDYCRDRAPYRDRIAGFVLCGGYSAEWQNWACHAAGGLNKLSDYSGSMAKAFDGFAMKRYPDIPPSDRAIPDLKTRLNHKNNSIFLPSNDFRRNLAYNDFLSQSVVDFATAMARQARVGIAPGQLLGIYYGYTFEYANLGWALQLSGHNALRRILDTPELDFLLSPPSYGIRSIGDCGEDMKPSASIRAAGKLAIIDDDTRTDMTGPVDFFQTVNRGQTRAVLRRNMGRTLCRMEPLCFYALTGGNEFSAPETVADLKRFKQAAATARRIGAHPVAEVAVVVSERAHLVMTMEKDKQPQGIRQWYNGKGGVSQAPRMVQSNSGESVYYQRTRLAQSGFVYDLLLAEDLARVADRPYKLWIFLNAYDPDEKFVATVAKIRASGATLLWLRAPGEFKDGRPGTAEFRRELTGFDLERLPDNAEAILRFPDGGCVGDDGPTAPLYRVNPQSGVKVLAEYESVPGAAGAAERMYGKGRSVFYGVDYLNPEFLRQLARQAGVHIYSESNDILYANSHFLTFHAATPGPKYVIFPAPTDVIDIFTGEVLTRGVKQWSFPAALHDTRVIFIGAAEDFFSR